MDKKCIIDVTYWKRDHEQYLLKVKRPVTTYGCAQCRCFCIKQRHHVSAVCDRSWVSCWQLNLSGCLVHWKIQYPKQRGKQGCKQDFPVVITHTANFPSMPVQRNPVVIIMCLPSLHLQLPFVYNWCLSEFWSHFSEVYSKSSNKQLSRV